MRYAVLFLVALAGCSVPTQEEVQHDVQSRLTAAKDDAVKSASGMANSAWAKAQAQVNKLNSNSSNDAIREAKAALVRAQNDLANLEMPKELEKLNSAYIREQLARLEATMDLKMVREKMDAAMQKAKQLPANAQATEAQIRQKLAETDSQFKMLQGQYDEATRNLESAQRSVEEASNKMKELGQSLP